MHRRAGPLRTSTSWPGPWPSGPRLQGQVIDRAARRRPGRPGSAAVAISPRPPGRPGGPVKSAALTVTSGNGPAAAVTPVQPRGRGQLGGAWPGPGRPSRSRRAALRGERVVERGAGVHEQRGPARRRRWRPAAPGRSRWSAPAAGSARRARRGRPGPPHGRTCASDRGARRRRRRLTASLAIRPSTICDGPAGVAGGQVGVVGDQHQGLPGRRSGPAAARRSPRRWRCPARRSARRPAAARAGSPAPGRSPPAAARRRTAGPGRRCGAASIRSAASSSAARARAWPRRMPGELRGQQHVVGDGQVVEQVEELEDHADLAPPEPRHPGLAELVDPLARHRDRRRWSAGPGPRSG